MVKFRFIAFLLINKNILCQHNTIQLGQVGLIFSPSFGTDNCLILGKFLDEHVSVISDTNRHDNNSLSQKMYLRLIKVTFQDLNKVALSKFIANAKIEKNWCKDIYQLSPKQSSIKSLLSEPAYRLQKVCCKTLSDPKACF